MVCHCNAALKSLACHVMPATVWNRAARDIVLQFGFGRATTVASEFLPRQDVRDDKPF
jgi:hypothetical protein